MLIVLVLLLLVVLLGMLVLVLAVLVLSVSVLVVVEGPIRYPEYQIRLHDVSRLSPPAHQSDKGQLLLSVRCQGDTKYHSILTSLAGADIEINRGGREGGGEGGEMLLSSRPSCIYCPQCPQCGLWTLWTPS